MNYYLKIGVADGHPTVYWMEHEVDRIPDMATYEWEWYKINPNTAIIRIGEIMANLRHSEFEVKFVSDSKVEEIFNGQETMA